MRYIFVQNLGPKSKIRPIRLLSALTAAFFDKISGSGNDFGHGSPLDAVFLPPDPCHRSPCKRLAAGQPHVDTLKSVVRRTVTAENQLQAPAGLDQSCGQVHQFLDDGLDPAPLGRMTKRARCAQQPELTEPTRNRVTCIENRHSTFTQSTNKSFPATPSIRPTSPDSHPAPHLMPPVLYI